MSPGAKLDTMQIIEQHVATAAASSLHYPHSRASESKSYYSIPNKVMFHKVKPKPLHRNRTINSLHIYVRAWLTERLVLFCFSLSNVFDFNGMDANTCTLWKERSTVIGPPKYYAKLLRPKFLYSAVRIV